MNKLFTTFGRAALVALGLAVAPAAFAQATCTGGTSPVWSGEGSPSASFTCTKECTGGNVVSITNNIASCVPPSGGDVQVSGCVLTPTNPAGVPSGGSQTYTASCSGGSPTSMTLTWSKTGPATLGSCATSLAVGAQTTCTASGITGNGTVSVSFTNNIGSAVSKTANYTVQAGGGGGNVDFSACPSGAQTISPGYGTYSAAAQNVIYLDQGQMVSMAMVVPSTGANTQKLKGQWNYYNVAGSWTYSITERACDIGGDTAVPTISTLTGNQVAGSKLVGTAPAGQGTQNYRVRSSVGATNGNLDPGKTYYLNVYAPNGASLIGTLQAP